MILLLFMSESREQMCKGEKRCHREEEVQVQEAAHQGGGHQEGRVHQGVHQEERYTDPAV